tara:strand:+ start:517 stop:873 length:357 start_codon:yes stop_codon:yes gene_type:complete
MSITEKRNNRRVWSEDFLSRYDDISVEDRYLSLVLGLVESGFEKMDYVPSSPLNRVSDLKLDGVIVRLYLVELNSDQVICYRVGLEGQFENEDTDTIFSLGLDTIWEDIRRYWSRGNS